jgi:26S proteasome regulatory subunit N6
MAVPTPAEEAKRIAEAQKVAEEDPAEAERVYKDVLSRNPGQSDAAIKNFETALVSLGSLYRDQKKVQELADLVQQTRSALSSFAKAKTAKLGELAEQTDRIYSKLTCVQSDSCSTS